MLLKEKILDELIPKRLKKVTSSKNANKNIQGPSIKNISEFYKYKLTLLKMYIKYSQHNKYK